MSRFPVILIAGWGYSSSAMHGLQNALPAGWPIIVASTHDCWLRSNSLPCRSPAPRGDQCSKRVADADSFGFVSSSNLFSRYADGLVSLIKEQGRKAIIAGWSMGGIVGLETAGRYPALISRLVLISSTAKFCSSKDYSFGIPEQNVRAMARGLRQNPELALARFYQLVSEPSHTDVLTPGCAETGRRGELGPAAEQLPACSAMHSIAGRPFYPPSPKRYGGTSRTATTPDDVGAVRDAAMGVENCKGLSANIGGSAFGGKFLNIKSGRFPLPVRERERVRGSDPSDSSNQVSAWTADELQAGLDYLRSTDLRYCLEVIRVPVLLVHGREDRVIPWQAGEWLSRRLACSRLCLYDTIGHDLPLRKPKALVPEIRRFLS